MEYVMVPVPEEHAEAVTRYLQWSGQRRRTVEPWDQDAISRFLRELDEPSRTLFLLTARACVDDLVLTVPGVAEAVGCSVNEVVGMTVALNDAVLAVGGPWFLLTTTELPSSPEVGLRSWSVNMVDATVAQAVLGAAEGASDHG